MTDPKPEDAERASDRSMTVSRTILDRAPDPRGSSMGRRCTTDIWIVLAAIGCSVLDLFTTGLARAGMKVSSGSSISAISTYSYDCGYAKVTEHGPGQVTITFYDLQGRMFDEVDREEGLANFIYADAAQAVTCGLPLSFSQG